MNADLMSNRSIMTIYLILLIIALIWAVWDEIKKLINRKKSHTVAPKNIQKRNKTRKKKDNPTQEERTAK